MSDRAMKVAVLEGDFVALYNLGLPFSISYQLQEKGLKLPEALWTAKSSAAGFSVSLFWPSTCETLKKKKRRKRIKAKSQSKPKETAQAIVNAEPMDKAAIGLSDSTSTPSEAHHPGASSPAISSVMTSTPDDPLPPVSAMSETPIDLATCSNINFEVRDGQPGVCYTANTGESSEWTPVVGRRRKRPRPPPAVCCAGFHPTTPFRCIIVTMKQAQRTKISPFLNVPMYLSSLYKEL